MIDFYNDKSEGITRLRASGSPMELATDFAVAATTLYARIKTANTNAAEMLKTMLMATFGEASPIWTAIVAKASEADVCSVVTIDRHETERQAREDQDADA